MLYWAIYFAVKVPVAYFAAKVAARYGPKHGIFVSNILYIPAMAALALVPYFGLPMIVAWGMCMATSSTLYQLCYVIDFSKIKSVKHAGKELGFMNILEKIAVGISPLIGGVIALLFGVQVIMWVAAVVFLLSALPLMRSAEPTRTRQQISFRNFPFAMAYRSLISQVGVGFDVVATGHIWGLFIAIVIFPGWGDEIYVSLGALSSITILTAIAISYAFGRLIDRNRGGDLLRFSVIANAVVHISRPFASGVAPIVTTNIANEVATTGVNMAYMRGVFDTADLSGHRIVYLCFVEMMTNFGASLACIALLVCASLLGDHEGLRMFFFVAAGFVLLEGTARFRLYRK
jgi:MFS family permease